MKKSILMLILILFSSILFSKQCSDEFSPEKFDQAPAYFEDLIDTNFGEIKIFGTKDSYKDFMFKLKGDTFFKPHSYTTFGDYIYPKKDGFWSYKLNDKGIVYIVNIAQIESEKLYPQAFAEMLNDDFENPWSKWDGDGYEHYMVPEFVRFKYKDKYISLKTYFWGIVGDAAKVDRSTINYQLIDFSKEVNTYIKCAK